ncbi:TolC family protein [Rapidithrix thailandica]|uniref:TolC family protein n=1 Tax=Rapidithrix thailandica TaxID=413964 RepID=A0AAW9SGE8_9BACT
MKKILAVLLLCAGPVWAQVDYDRVILPEGNTSQEQVEKLIRTAWKNYPENKILQHKITISEYEIRKAKVDWSKDIRASFNLNEGNIDPPENGANLFYPRYNMGVTLPLSTLLVTPKQVKIAKQNHQIAKEELNQQKLFIRKIVLIKYQHYLSAKKVFQVQSEITEEQYSKYVLAEQQFKNGEIELETFNETLRSYNTERLNKIKAEEQLLTSKIELEELVGVPLEEV